MTSPECTSETRARTLWPRCSCPRHSALRSRIRRLRDKGLYDRVTAEAATVAFDALVARGYDARAIASACDLPLSTVKDWYTDRRRKLPMKPGPLACDAIVNAGTPTSGHLAGFHPLIAKRKLQALARLGWGVPELADTAVSLGLLSGNPRGSMFDMRAGRRPIISAQLYNAIDSLYRRLELTRAPERRGATKSINQAIRSKWAAPAAWDDIEDPSGVPHGRLNPRLYDPSRKRDSLDPIAVERVCMGDGKGVTLTTAERDEVIRTLRERGMADYDIELRTGIRQLSRFPRQLPQATESRAS